MKLAFIVHAKYKNYTKKRAFEFAAAAKVSRRGVNLVKSSESQSGLEFLFVFNERYVHYSKKLLFFGMLLLLES